MNKKFLTYNLNVNGLLADKYSLVVLVMEIEHFTGKAARELVRNGEIS